MISAAGILYRERLGRGADITRGARILAERRPAEVRDPRALDPRVATPAEDHYARRCARLQGGGRGA